MDPHAFFLPSFLEAISGNTIHHFNDIIHEPTPKVYAFPMLRPAFCENAHERGAYNLDYVIVPSWNDFKVIFQWLYLFAFAD
jgi:hypothetical protein